MNRIYAWLATFAMIATFGLIVPASATAAPYCGITWGSLAKTSSSNTSAPITDVRTGKHSCFDRMVVDIDGTGAGYTVRYVTAVHEEGSGRIVPLRGTADLAVTVNAPTYDRYGHAIYRPANRNELTNVTGYSTFRQLALAGSYEGQTTIGVGVRARLPFRTFVLNGPGAGSRLVIDVAHRW